MKFQCDQCGKYFEEKDLIDKEVLQFCFKCVEKNKKKFALLHSRMEETK
jgi:predicted  nucleic acid-binding Zn-ribbon protein